ncbi:MAG: hypothetical protein IKN63_02470 [Bacilli bacterium]|nr:hypothetical protein [Bacilli bacterium]
MLNPYIISNIIVSVVFLILLIFNYTFENKMIKNIFLIYSCIYLILILFFDHNFIYELFKTMITYIWYPNYLLFVMTTLITLIILIYTLVKKYMKKINMIINYILVIITFVCYNMFNTLDIDPLIASELYTTLPLVIMRVANISFVVWIIITVGLKIRRKYEK